MDKLFKAIADRPILSAIAALALCLVFAWYMPGLKVDTSANGFIIQDSEQSRFYEEAKKVFGDDISITVVYKTQDVFTSEILQSIEDLTFAAEQLDGVTKVLSLTNVSNLKGGDGYLNTDQLITYVPHDDPDELARIKQDALNNVLHLGEVVNHDGSVAAVHLYIESRPSDHDFEQGLVEQVDALMAQQRTALDGKVHIYQVGNPLVQTSMLDSIQRDISVITPLTVLVVAIVLLFFFRSVSAVVLPVVTGTLSVFTTLGFMALSGYALNPVALVIPSLLLVIGSTEDIHILAEYMDGIRSKLEKRQAIRRMAARCGLVIFLTAITTLAGFATVIPNKIPILREFAIAASFGITINFIVTVLLAPAVLHALKIPQAFQTKEPKFIELTRGWLMTLPVGRQLYVYGFFGALLLISIFGALKLEVDTQYLLFFREDAPVREAFRDIDQDLSGASIFYVVVDSGESNGLHDPKLMQDIARLSDFLQDTNDKALGFDTLLRKSHQEMNGGDKAFFKVPDDPDLIAQYALLMDPDTMARFVDFDFRRTCIVVRSNIEGSRDMNAKLPAIHEFIETQLDYRLDVKITGEAVLVAEASDTISEEILLNILYMVIAIFLLISILFLSPKAGLLTLIPNVLPIVVNFGIMGFMGIPLSASTFPIAVIALGTAVDDTIHFMVTFSKQIRKTSSNEKAVAATISHEIRPVAATSTALCLGYITLTAADFGSVAQFGMLCAVTMFVAMISDLVLTPALLRSHPLITSWDLFQMKVDPHLLERSPLLKGLKTGEIKRFALISEIHEFKPGEHLITQGAADEQSMYLLLSGEAAVNVEGKQGKTTRLASIQSGDIAGEISFLSDSARSANVTALTATRALKIDAPTLQRVSKRFPKLGTKIYSNMSTILATRLNARTTDLWSKV